VIVEGEYPFKETKKVIVVHSAIRREVAGLVVGARKINQYC
jgi:hypothetical protein